jgi:ankyrin repeat protein
MKALIRLATLGAICLISPVFLFAGENAFQAIEKGDTEQLQNLLKKKTDPDAQRAGETLLVHAIAHNNPAAVDLLLKAGAKPDYRPKPYNVLPLILAATTGQTEIVQMLVQHGAAVNARSITGDTPLLQAVIWGRDETVAFLLQKGADANLANYKGTLPILLAAERSDSNLVRILLEEGKADPNARREGLFPLYTAGNYGRVENIRILLAHGANPAQRTAEGKSASDIATEHGYEITASVLREAEVAGAASIVPLLDKAWAYIDGVQIWLKEPTIPYRIISETPLEFTSESFTPPVLNAPDATRPAVEEEVYSALKQKLHDAADAAGARAVIVSGATNTQQTIYVKTGGTSFGSALLGNILIGSLAGISGCQNCGPVILPSAPNQTFNKVQYKFKARLRFVKFDGETFGGQTTSADTTRVEISPAVSRWNDLRFSNDVQALESYVRDFPEGQYTPLAESRIVSARQALEKAKLPPVLFVYNIELSFGGSQFFVDGKPIVKLGSMRYAKIRLQPGLRHFQLVSLKGPVVDVNVNGGDEIYLPVRGGMSPNVGIQPQASPAVAKELFAKGTLKPAKPADILDAASIIP